MTELEHRVEQRCFDSPLVELLELIQKLGEIQKINNKWLMLDEIIIISDIPISDKT
jgi:hypothetical protein